MELAERCPICGGKLEKTRRSESDRTGRSEPVFYCRRCKEEATLSGLKILAQVERSKPTAPREKIHPGDLLVRAHQLFNGNKKAQAARLLRNAGYTYDEIRKFFYTWGSMGPSGESLITPDPLSAAKSAFDIGDKRTAVDILRRHGYSEREIERLIYEKWTGKTPQKPEGIPRPDSARTPRDGFLTARAILFGIKKGSRKVEVNAIIEWPQHFPEVLVNKEIPFENIPLPPGRYSLIARYNSPEYGPLKDRKTVTINSRKTTKIEFTFIPPRGGGGGPIDIDVESRAEAEATAIARGEGGGRRAAGRGPELTGGIYGFVKNVEGVPIKDAIVRIIELPESAPEEIEGIEQMKANTDEHGEYRIPEVPVLQTQHYVRDTYSLEAKREFRDARGKTYVQRKEAIATVEPGKWVECNFTLDIPTPYLYRVGKDGELKERIGVGGVWDSLSASKKEKLLGKVRHGKMLVDAGAHNMKWDDLVRDHPSIEKELRGELTEPLMKKEMRREGWDTFLRKRGKTGRELFFSLFVLIIGIVISAMFGIWQFIIAAAASAGFIIIPDARKTLVPEVGPYEPERDEHEEGWKPSRETGYMWRGGNRGNSGLAATKALFKVVSIFFYGWALWDFSKTSFPFASFIFIGFAFISYFSLPGTYDPEQPYEVMSGVIRFLIGAIVLPFMIFLGIFNSFPLALIAFAFFAVVPTPTKTTSLAQILGKGLAGGLETAETLDKLIFIGIMITGLAVTTGTVLIPLPFFQVWAGSWGLQGSMLYVFYAVWFISAIAGFFSPPETRPYTGILMLTTALVIFGLGPGSQTLGGALFGDWWPTIHNTITEVMSPMGEIFSQFQNTFGQSWLLLTNPVGYAKMITEGTYTTNPLGPTGAYGLEIDRFDVQSIYPEEPFMISINLANKGTFEAKNVKLALFTTIAGFKLSYNGKELKMTKGKNYDYNQDIYIYEMQLDKNIEKQDVKDLFIVGNLSCPSDKQLAETREKYIPFTANVTYDYETESNLQIDFISEEEWTRLSDDNRLTRNQVQSKISTAPAKLSIGTVDQPIKEGNPFFIGFNLTSAEGKNSQIGAARVWLSVPKEFNTITAGNVNCNNGAWNQANSTSSSDVIDFYFKTISKSSFCSYFSGVSNIKVPKKTYTISAGANYTFSRWEEKDTLINFRDVCFAKFYQKELPAISVCEGVPQTFVAGYNTYKDVIITATEGDKNLAVLAAAIISQESAWDKNAVSECGAAGIAQFIPSTAEENGLTVYNYELVPIETTNCTAKGYTKIGSCHKYNLDACCTLRRTDCVDERFIPEKAIPAMVNHLKSLISIYGDSGGAYEAVIKAYHGGYDEALKQEYYNDVNLKYSGWKSCIG